MPSRRHPLPHQSNTLHQQRSSVRQPAPSVRQSRCVSTQGNHCCKHVLVVYALTNCFVIEEVEEAVRAILLRQPGMGPKSVAAAVRASAPHLTTKDIKEEVTRQRAARAGAGAGAGGGGGVSGLDLLLGGATASSGGPSPVLVGESDAVHPSWKKVPSASRYYSSRCNNSPCQRKLETVRNEFIPGHLVAICCCNSISIECSRIVWLLWHGNGRPGDFSYLHIASGLKQKQRPTAEPTNQEVTAHLAALADAREARKAATSEKQLAHAAEQDAWARAERQRERQQQEDWQRQQRMQQAFRNGGVGADSAGAGGAGRGVAATKPAWMLKKERDDEAKKLQGGTSAN
jgi:hypothetical protein